jgi:hypothetical protein
VSCIVLQRSHTRSQAVPRAASAGVFRRGAACATRVRTLAASGPKINRLVR